MRSHRRHVDPGSALSLLVRARVNRRSGRVRPSGCAIGRSGIVALRSGSASQSACCSMDYSACSRIEGSSTVARGNNRPEHTTCPPRRCPWLRALFPAVALNSALRQAELEDIAEARKQGYPIAALTRPASTLAYTSVLVNDRAQRRLGPAPGGAFGAPERCPVRSPATASRCGVAGYRISDGDVRSAASGATYREAISFDRRSDLGAATSGFGARPARWNRRRDALPKTARPADDP